MLYKMIKKSDWDKTNQDYKIVDTNKQKWILDNDQRKTYNERVFIDEECDEGLAVDMASYIDSYERHYIQFNCICKNYNKKREKGVFDFDLAIKGMLNLVNNIWIDYKKRNNLNIRLDNQTKRICALILLESYLNQN